MTPGYTPATPNLARGEEVMTPLTTGGLALAANFPSAAGPQQAYHPMAQQMMQQQQQQQQAPQSVGYQYPNAPAAAPAYSAPVSAPVGNVYAPPAATAVAAAAAPPAAPDMASAPMPPEYAQALASLNDCFTRFASSMQKRMADDITKSVDKLREKFQLRQMSSDVAAQTLQMCQALGAQDFDNALKIQVSLATSAWDDHGVWLKGIKILITQAKKSTGR